jgi:hypothetical protein
MHAPAQRIVGKLRASLLPRSVEQLTLAYHYLREEAKVQLQAMGPVDLEAALDKMEADEYAGDGLAMLGVDDSDDDE